MDSIARSFVNATALILAWDGLPACASEDELRTAYMGAFLHVREAHLTHILLREAKPPDGFEKRLDLYLIPTWPPAQTPHAAVELKLFRRDQVPSYRTAIGRRLADIHYVECHSKTAKIFTFFLDIVLLPEVVGRRAYNSLKSMCQVASTLMYDQTPSVDPEDLKNQERIKAFADAAQDFTPRKHRRKRKYGFLFPPFDLPGGSGRAKRGTAIVRAPNDDGLISIGTRRSNKEQASPYRRVLLLDGTEAAFCFAGFAPGGSLVADTNTVLKQLELTISTW